MTTKAKEHAFPVTVGWRRARTVEASVHGKAQLDVATPPQFDRNADPATWSPEDLLTAAAATCLAVTIAGAAERAAVTLEHLSVDATGVVGMRDDGRYGFTRIEQRVAVTASADDVEQVRAIVERAESTCLVAASLDVPIETSIEVSRSQSPATA
jgi:peroxiredoxin-like protein